MLRIHTKANTSNPKTTVSRSHKGSFLISVVFHSSLDTTAFISTIFNLSNLSLTCSSVSNPPLIKYSTIRLVSFICRTSTRHSIGIRLAFLLFICPVLYSIAKYFL